MRTVGGREIIIVTRANIYYLSSCYVSGTILRHVTLISTLGGKYHYPHLINKETKVQVNQASLLINIGECLAAHA